MSASRSDDGGNGLWPLAVELRGVVGPTAVVGGPPTPFVQPPNVLKKFSTFMLATRSDPAALGAPADEDWPARS